MKRVVTLEADMVERIPGRAQKAAAAADALVLGMDQQEGLDLKRSRLEAAEMGKPAVGPLSRTMLANPRWQVRWAAAKALGSISDPASAVALVGALEDDNSDVGWVAGEALATLGDAALPPLLSALVARPGSPGLRIGTRHVLRGRKRLDHHDRTVGLLAAIEDGATDEAAAVAALAVIEAAPKAPRARMKLKPKPREAA